MTNCSNPRPWHNTCRCREGDGFDASTTPHHSCTYCYFVRSAILIERLGLMLKTGATYKSLPWRLLGISDKSRTINMLVVAMQYGQDLRYLGWVTGPAQGAWVWSFVVARIAIKLKYRISHHRYMQIQVVLNSTKRQFSILVFEKNSKKMHLAGWNKSCTSK